jgi:hypothetical protein|tara:strand:+ start:3612 stop:3908 length:297 start_codon:yes stop_codon:yes gene_type:complete
MSDFKFFSNQYAEYKGDHTDFPQTPSVLCAKMIAKSLDKELLAYFGGSVTSADLEDFEVIEHRNVGDGGVSYKIKDRKKGTVKELLRFSYADLIKQEV